MKALKIGCLSCLLIIAFFIILIIGYAMWSASLMGSESVSIQTPFEVMTKKGTIKLHLGIPQDSVILLIGKPDDIESHSIGITVVEEIGYKVNSDDYPDLSFTFENGKLESFSQR